MSGAIDMVAPALGEVEVRLSRYFPIINQEDNESGVITKDKVIVKRPSRYHIFLLNDDYTPMDFVVNILERYFHKDHVQATEIMLQVHQKGKGLCGTYALELAETKVSMVTDEARQNGYPLRCIMEKE